MFNINKFFSVGAKNTIQLKDNGGFSHSGPWKSIHGKTLVERWYLGDFSSVDYTIAIDLNSNHKEISKCLVTAAENQAKIVVYAKNNTNDSLVDFSAIVNESYVELYVIPKSSNIEGAKFFFTANYFSNQNPA